IADSSKYNWEGDAPLHRAFSKTVIYELHVGGFTRSPTSRLPDQMRGTYAGLIEKIPYLKRLGITAIELMPVFAFDPYDAPLGKQNYWGYAPVSFFAPHPHYSANKDPLGVLDEFRDMVKALHRAGLEVILDVVFNHTAEGSDQGPTFSLRGLENETYYILEKNRRYYSNYTGTGNTLNANHPIVRRMILDSLRYWVAEMHVDGFRFDLASILSRNEHGVPLADPPTLLDIENDPVLAGTKLIAEAWDAAGLYQVGQFVGERWQEWNGKFRDDIRRWVKGDPGMIDILPDRLLASPDIYEHEDREVAQSVNFVACHDGFTLYDVVSYNEKHNEANGENNRDGHNDNQSWNHGIEGPTTDPAINELRQRQVKNFLAYTLLSMGTPMLYMGDEVMRSQWGNNNAYSQDNELSWFNWDLPDWHPGMLRLTSELIRLRMNYFTGREDENRTLAQVLREARIEWHGVHLYAPDWGRNSHSLAMTVFSDRAERQTHIMMNAYWEDLDFELPILPNRLRWRRVLDTNLPSPQDISRLRDAVIIDSQTYRVKARSVVMLIAGT
ncbi:MAG: glycogen debranching enzyme, partial [Anaerolineae bacterium]|nr:glycogen debranching enzyme [Anaerolineae bacterium]